LADILEVKDSQGGIDICAYFKFQNYSEFTDAAIAATAYAAGLRLQPLSQYYNKEPAKQGLVFGLAIFDEPALSRNLLSLRSIILSHIRL